MQRRPSNHAILSWLTALVLLAGCATGGGSAPGAVPPLDPGVVPPSAGNDPYTGVYGNPNDPQAAGMPPAKSGPSVGQRAQSALQGMVMGAALGSMFGPIGMAAGAGTMLIYGAITGEVPLRGGGGGGGGYGGGAPPPYGGPYDPGGIEAQREAEMERELGGELARGDVLEDEIQAELQRQEELLRQIEQQEALRDSAARAINEPMTDPQLAERVDPRSAPLAPKDRELPAAIFEEQRTTIPKKSWDNDKKLVVLQRTLDADRDGKPEQIRYFDEKSGELVRKEQDRNYDGRSDTWNAYEGGQLVSRKLDNNADGRVDVWEIYADGRMVSREVDRDGDTVRDAFYTYEGDVLTSERHDADNDGSPDLLVTYRNRYRVMTEEDTDRNGALDTWTSWSVVGGREVMARIERDTNGDGRRDLFETYESVSGRPVLTRREEDKNGDGNIDITSIYENGRLKTREISDPELVPL
jgi:antitoxin component YwqK of YwqJK toxin-antitoxin module